MRKVFALLAAVILLIGVTGCGAQITEGELLAQAYDNMKTLESSRSTGSITISAMGMTMDPIEYEVLYEKPDKTYMKMDADFFGMGETTSFEILVQGEDIKIRSALLDQLDEQTRAAMEASLTTDMENPQEYEDMFLELQETTNYEIVDNPDGLDPKEFKTFKITLDADKLREQVAGEMNMDDFLPPEAQGMDPAELAELQTAVEQMLTSMEVEMEAILVVNTETGFFKQLTMDMNMKLPFPAVGTQAPQVMEMDYTIDIDYLEINTDLDFPDFQ